jgi:hypothetical protein
MEAGPIMEAGGGTAASCCSLQQQPEAAHEPDKAGSPSRGPAGRLCVLTTLAGALTSSWLAAAAVGVAQCITLC